MRFDDWLARSGVAHVDVCKVDVEGHEEAVFRGMRRSLEDRRVGSVIFERHGDAGPGDPVIEMFRARDFLVVQIRKRAFRAEYVDVGRSGPGVPTADFVAVLRGSEAEHRMTALRRSGSARQRSTAPFVHPSPSLGIDASTERVATRPAVDTEADRVHEGHRLRPRRRGP
jgi:hypothetical protein